MSGLPEGDRRHGTLGGYNNWRCRCAACREAHRLYAYEHRQLCRRERQVPADAHGKQSTYANWGCRCDLCRAAHAVASRDWRRQKALR